MVAMAAGPSAASPLIRDACRYVRRLVDGYMSVGAVNMQTWFANMSQARAAAAHQRQTSTLVRPAHSSSDLFQFFMAENIDGLQEPSGPTAVSAVPLSPRALASS